MAVKTSGIVLASRYKYFIDTAGGTDFIAWNGNDCGNVDGGNASLMWIHLDD